MLSSSQLKRSNENKKSITEDELLASLTIWHKYSLNYIKNMNNNKETNYGFFQTIFNTQKEVRAYHSGMNLTLRLH